MIITIDGPTASGKSTIARLLAEKLDFYYLNTGSLYRALAYVLTERKKYNYTMLACPIKEDLQEIIDPSRLIYTYNNGSHIVLDNIDITKHLKDASIDKAASIVSGVPRVREMFLQFQRSIAKDGNVVAEGRDTGSVIFPDADYKFYLTAHSTVRARRWLEMQHARGNNMTLDEAEWLITERDDRDSKRAIAPLRIPQGAIVIDNSTMSQEETLQKFLEKICLKKQFDF